MATPLVVISGTNGILYVTGGAAASLVWRPGTASVGSAVETWAEVQAFIASSNGSLIVACDNSLGACVIPGSSGTTDFGGRVTLVPYASTSGAAPGFTGVTVTVEDGAVLEHLTSIRGYLTLLFDCKTVTPLVYTQTAGLEDIIQLDGAGLMTTLTATRPACEVTGTLVVQMVNTLLGQAGGQPVFHVSGPNVDLVLDSFDFPNVIDSGAVTGTMSGGSIVEFFHGASTAFQVFPGVTGGTQMDDRTTLAQWIQPSSGNTAARPSGALVQVGQMYFDTQLAAGAGKPVWWNGSTWVDATGTPA